MAKALTRTERSGRNRARVLDAARRVFVERGYHGATLEQIAAEAGFTKGVVYSQFESKADLFLALLELRITERALENVERLDGLAGDEAVATLLEHVSRESRTDPKWPLVVIEFRVHAARDESLNGRYAALHERTVGALADLFSSLYERAGAEPPLPPQRMAEVVLAIGNGTQLEQAASPEALGGELVARGARRRCSPGSDRRPGREPGMTAGAAAAVEAIIAAVGSELEARLPGPRRAARVGRRQARRPSARPPAGAARDGDRAIAVPRPAPARHRPADLRARRPPGAAGDGEGGDDGGVRRGGDRPAARPAHGRGPPGRLDGEPEPAAGRVRLPRLGRQLRPARGLRAQRSASTRTSAPRSCAGRGPGWWPWADGRRRASRSAWSRPRLRSTPPASAPPSSRRGPFRFEGAPATAPLERIVELLKRISPALADGLPGQAGGARARARGRPARDLAAGGELDQRAAHP